MVDYFALKGSEAEKIKYINRNFDGGCYVASKILINIYPTLFRDKPASLIRLRNLRDRKLLDLWDKHKEELSIPGIETFELRRDGISVTLLFYNQTNLIKTIYDRRNLRFLSRYGYSATMDLNEMLNHLKKRFSSSCCHEVGIFLGIPLKDVLGYLGLISLPCNLCGHWKVYGRADQTEQTFAEYKATKNRLMELIVEGEKPSVILKNHQCYRSTIKRGKYCKYDHSQAINS